jgi:hypothetical protein
MLGIPLSRRHVGGLLLAGPAGTIVGRSNTVSSGPLAWVMIHRHHAAERTGLGLDQNAWVSFGKQGWVNSRERRSQIQTVIKSARFVCSPYTATEMQGFAQVLADSIRARIQTGQNIYDQGAAPLKAGSAGSAQIF